MKNEAIKYIHPDGKRPALAILPLIGKSPEKLTAHGCYDATRDRDQIEKWWTQYPTANIGIATGEINGLLVIDVDVKPDQGKFGDESLKELESELGELPQTWEAITGSGGRHLYFKYPVGHEIKNSTSKLGKHIDIRANGGLMVAPPSIHPETGKRYEWECSGDPVETELAELPEKWIQRLEQIGKGETLGESQKRAFEIPDVVPEGERNDTLFKYGASLRSRSTPALKTLELLRQFNDEKCTPSLPDKEVVKVFESVMKYPAGTSENEIMNSRNHEDMSTELSQFHLYNKKQEPTGVYDFRIYEYLSQNGDLFITGGVPYHYKDGVSKGDVTGTILKTSIRKLIFPWLIRSPTIDRIFKLFLSAEELQVTVDEFNSHPKHWVNFKNSFYDPQTGKMISHDKKYRSVNQIPHVYDPDAQLDGDRIENFLSQLVPDPDDREMLLEYIGYCMTVDTRFQKMMILLGLAGSGKSTLISIIEYIVGVENMSHISLADLPQRFASYGLLGKLLNSCGDLEVTALENTGMIKSLLGEDSMRFEAKGKDAVSGKNYAKMLFSCNQLPLVLDERSAGFYRRLMVLNINNQPKEENVYLLDELKPQIGYLIRLAMEALAKAYQRGHLMESAGSQQAVKELRNDSDTVEAWINDECSRVFGKKEERTKLYQAYDKYCFDADRTALKRNQFYRAMRTKNFKESKSNGYRYFEGITLGENCPENCPEWVDVADQMELPFSPE